MKRITVITLLLSNTYTKMVSKQVDSVLKALYSTPAGKTQSLLSWLTMVMGWLHTAW